MRSLIAASAAIAGVAAVQQVPLVDSSSATSQVSIQGDKPLINSTALQELISGDRLMQRAQELYEIAKKGEEEYNHPTRVIGSQGGFRHVTLSLELFINTHCYQAIMKR